MRVIYTTDPKLIGEMDFLIRKEDNPINRIKYLLHTHNLVAYGRPSISIKRNRLDLEERE